MTTLHPLSDPGAPDRPQTAREVLAQAEASQPDLGHSPKGFLSRSHGFLPVTPPLLALPKTHQAWDETAALLPQLFSTQRVCPVLDQLPLLSGAAEALDEAYLWRAAVVLGYLAHAYAYQSPHSNSSSGGGSGGGASGAKLPSALAIPWEQVNQRLGRPGPGISTVDYCCYNWILKDSAKARRVENLDLLVSWCGNAEEIIFLNSVTEMHGYSADLVRAATELQDGMVADRVEDVKVALHGIFDFLGKMTFRSLLKIDPNPYSNTHVDPLIWSKAFASITAPINAYERGLGGSGTPIIQLLDALFERSAYNTLVSQESLKLRDWLPAYHRQFIETFRHFSLSDFVTRSGDKELAGLYNSVFDAYAGRRGFLSMHRLKVYGFMELGFKIGRTETNSGFAGETEKRAWEELDDTLEATRCERYVGKSPYSLRVKRQVVQSAVANANTPIHQVVLDIAGQGLEFLTGDRLGIFPQNSSKLVQKTLQALQAKGDEPIRLTRHWRDALESITHQSAHTIPLETFLTFAKLRPLLRSVAKDLLQVSRSRRISQVLENRQEDQMELWDAFELLSRENYDVKRFWKAAPWEVESLARIVPMENFRIYSIASAPFNGAANGAANGSIRPEGKAEQSHEPGQTLPRPEQLHLTVGRLTFDSKPVGAQAEQVRQGTASSYLVQALQDPASEPEITVQVFHPSRFHLPDDPQRPIVMFAGGTGISPFRGFLEHRAAQAESGPNWLFLGTRSLGDLPYGAELRNWVAQGKLNLRVAFSREEQRLESDQGQLVLRSSAKGYVDHLLEDEAVSALLWQYLQRQEDGGLEGYFYICGQANFGHTVIEGIQGLIARHLPGTRHVPGTVRDKTVGAMENVKDVEDKDIKDIENQQEAARIFFRHLTGQNRFMLDMFTTFAPVAAASVHGFETFDASEVIQHNNAQQGYWTTIQGNVYDVSEFMYLHPGGQRLLMAAAGIDSTRSYEKVEHHLNSEVHSQLDLYKIGQIRRLNFGDLWGIAIKPAAMAQQGPAQKSAQGDARALMSLSLHDFYRHWIRFTYQIVEIENSLNNNFSIRSLSVARPDPPEAMGKLKAQLLLNAHDTFYDSSVGDILGPKLELLWAIALGFCAADLSITQLPQEIARTRSSPNAQKATEQRVQLTQTLQDLAPTPEEAPQAWANFNRQLQHLEQCDQTFIAALKSRLRQGLVIFEQYEELVIKRGKVQLVEALEGIPTVVEDYYTALSVGYNTD
jgi:sulfite reductase (NADPH) flavoprotein alpha-component